MVGPDALKKSKKEEEKAKRSQEEVRESSNHYSWILLDFFVYILGLK